MINKMNENNVDLNQSESELQKNNNEMIVIETIGPSDSGMSKRTINKKDLILSDIKCEFGDCCKHIAKIRMTKKDTIRVFNSLDNFSSSTLDIIREIFVCVSCAEYLLNEWKIEQWIKEKLPYDLLFNYNHEKWAKYEDEHSIKYWEISDEHGLRWDEQKFCSNCGNKLTHEVRIYPKDDGYESHSRWTEAYKIVICYNCGFFDYYWMSKRGYYSRKEELEGKYSEYGNPNYDPDNRKWEKILKEMKEKEILNDSES